MAYMCSKFPIQMVPKFRPFNFIQLLETIIRVISKDSQQICHLQQAFCQILDPSDVEIFPNITLHFQPSPFLFIEITYSFPPLPPYEIVLNFPKDWNFIEIFLQYYLYLCFTLLK